ncbi:MAG: hypothetical protein EA380_03270 [Phycisphaeraceae bacterium]|nr:MAG: hypothetical protein EA380_03270 [Phycisphaeraceae bacterium]
MSVRVLIICGLMIHLLTSGFGIVLACCDRHHALLTMQQEIVATDGCCECCPYASRTPEPPAKPTLPDQEDDPCCGTWCPGATKRFLDDFEATLRDAVGQSLTLPTPSIAHPAIAETRSHGFMPRIEHDPPRYESAPAWCAQVCIWLQ